MNLNKAVYLEAGKVFNNGRKNHGRGAVWEGGGGLSAAEGISPHTSRKKNFSRAKKISPQANIFFCDGLV